jgi:hypothetical protein
MGGIYVNVDVVLEVHLDALLDINQNDENAVVDGDHNDGTAALSLIVVRNPNIIQPHCIYNVLLAAAPGHPVIQSKLEATLQSFRNAFTSSSRATNIWQYYLNNITSEEEISTFPIWKLHVVPTTSSSGDLDYYNGNCLWGMSLNRALQHHPMADLHIWGPRQALRIVQSEGSTNQTTQFGNVLILMVRALYIVSLDHYSDSFKCLNAFFPFHLRKYQLLKNLSHIHHFDKYTTRPVMMILVRQESPICLVIY